MDEEIRRLRTVADYQFGAGAGTALFADGDAGGGGDGTGALTVRHTSTGRPEQVLADGERLVSYGVDGRFTLGVAGGWRLYQALEAPAYRVVVGDDSEPFVRDGRNAFAKFVREVDPAVRPGDEVLVVHERYAERDRPDEADLLAVGRAELPAAAMLDFQTGMAVKVREGAEDVDTAPE